MNLTPLWVPLLRQHGFEATHWSDRGPVNAPDTDILERAATDGFVVFTHDLDFGRLLAIHRRCGPSVVQMRTQDVLPAVVGDLLIRALTAAHANLESGSLVTIDPSQHRIRMLPI